MFRTRKPALVLRHVQLEQLCRVQAEDLGALHIVAVDCDHIVHELVHDVERPLHVGEPADCTEAVEQLLQNLDTVLWEARVRGIWVYVTLLDANTIAKITGAIRTWGVALLNNTGGEQAAFNTNVLAPTLQVLDNHKDNPVLI